MSVEIVLRSIFSLIFLASVIRISTPIILPAFGGLIANRAGVSNMALEGIMNAGAFTGVIVSAFTQNIWLSLLSGLLVGMLMAAVLAFFHLRMNANLTLAALALNLFSSGITVFLLYVFTGDKGNSSDLTSLKLAPIAIPFLKDIPILGDILSGHWAFTYIAFFLAFLTYIFLYRTPFGVHLRAVGENPDAATSLGINVNKYRTVALILSGAFAAIGGMTLSMAYMPLFQRDMAAGRGWIALAAIQLGNRMPLGVLLASILFGFSDSISNQLGSLKIPTQLVQTIPYVTTVLALLIYAIQQRREIVNRVKKFQQQHAEARLAASQGKQ